MSNRPTIVIDLDGTILRRRFIDWFKLYLVECDSVGVPFAKVVETLKSLSESYNVVAITARARMARPNTLRWLERFGLDFCDLHLSSAMHFRDSPRAAYKSAVLEKLAAEGHDIRFGMGDRPSDFCAYADHGIYPIVVIRPHQKHRLDKIRAIARSRGLTQDDYSVFVEGEGVPAWTGIAELIARQEPAEKA
ncbi:MAG: hypothetical protein U5N86_04555 [Planctomycetota bacterium]|nr:hypothetical protein [Planctomycetota bacterium]